MREKSNDRKPMRGMRTRGMVLALTSILLFYGLSVPTMSAIEPPEDQDCNWGGGNRHSGGGACTDLCLQTFSDMSDFDSDYLSDRVESCYLGTDWDDADTDGDGIPDGLDGNPLADKDVPLYITVSYINQVQENNNCDPNNNWDPYIDVFGYDFPTLQEEISLSFQGWSKTAHRHDRPHENFGTSLIGLKESGTGWVSGNTVRFDLDQDLRKWNAGQSKLDLFLTFDALVVDHDGRPHHPDGNDDYMVFSNSPRSVLGLGPENIHSFLSKHAYDADTGYIHCQTGIGLRLVFHDLNEEVLDAAQARLQRPGILIDCANSWMNGCVKNGNWDA